MCPSLLSVFRTNLGYNKVSMFFCFILILMAIIISHLMKAINSVREFNSYIRRLK